MGISEWWIKQRLKVINKRIEKDIQKNEKETRKKLILILVPLLDVFQVEDVFTNNKGEKEKREITSNDIKEMNNERLIELSKMLLTELEKKV